MHPLPSSSALLQPLLLPCAVAAPVFMAGDLVFWWCLPADTLDHLPPVPRGTCILGSHGAVTVGETVLGRLSSLPFPIPTPRPQQCTDHRPKQTLSLSEKTASILSEELWPEAQASGAAHVWEPNL